MDSGNVKSVKMSCGQIYCGGDVVRYIRLRQLGEGLHGKVFLAKDQMNQNSLVALKEIRANKDDPWPLTAQKETAILRKVNHENVIKLLEVCCNPQPPKSITSTIYYLALDLCETDMKSVINNHALNIFLSEVKAIAYQMINALEYLHSHKILHRDIKPSNILLKKDGLLKLADFGNGRMEFHCDNKTGYHSRVVSLFYRAPELLLGEVNYGPAIDIWAVGCFIVETLTRKALFYGETELDIFLQIISWCGSITTEDWPEAVHLPNFRNLTTPPYIPRTFTKQLSALAKDVHTCSFLNMFFVCNPEKRITARVALNHVYFWTDPSVAALNNMLTRHLNILAHNANMQATQH